MDRMTNLLANQPCEVFKVHNIASSKNKIRCGDENIGLISDGRAYVNGNNKNGCLPFAEI